MFVKSWLCFNSFFLFFLLSVSANAKNSPNHDLVDAKFLKSSGYVDGQSGTVAGDLNSDGHQDIIEYTYASATPPGTCEQQDCIDKLDDTPMITFQVRMSDGKIIDAPYMCTSLALLDKKHNGMKDIFCGPEYRLFWNGREYMQD